MRDETPPAGLEGEEEPKEPRLPARPENPGPEPMGGEPPCHLPRFWDVDDDDQ